MLEPGLPTRENFWAKVNIPDDQDACWEWIGALSHEYGVIGTHHKNVRAHRYSYELHLGIIPEGMLVCHSCDNPPCVNPAHLFLGTQADNLKDMRTKGRGKLPQPCIGENNSQAKLTWDDVTEIRSLFTANQYTQTKLAKVFGVSVANINRIVHHQNWRTKDSPPPKYPGRTKLTEHNVRTIRTEYASGTVSQQNLASRYNVSRSLITQIINKKRRVRVI